MELGISVPTYNAPLTSPEAIALIATEAERIGYAAVWTYERLLYPTGNVDQPGIGLAPLHEVYKVAYDPLVTLGYLAATTRRIKLGTAVVDAPFHVPVVLARQFASLDRFSGGRVIAGLGQGWMAQEFETSKSSTRRRGPGVDEFVAAMRSAWGPDPVTFDGRHYRIPESLVDPKPVQPGGPPIVMGALSPPAVARAARIADGIMPIAFSYEQLAGTVDAFRSAAHAAGRDVAALKVIVRSSDYKGLSDSAAEDQHPFLGGSPEQIAADLERVRPLDIDHVFFATGYASSLEEQVRLMERLMDAVAIPSV